MAVIKVLIVEIAFVSILSYGYVLEAWQDDWMRLLNRRLAYSNPQQARCLDVPKNLTLCGTMGYDRMRIPNFLEQWNINNIIAEAEVWNKRLAEARCNDAHSRLFLCSVLAPVCVENKAEPVPPCRNICQSVQRTCERPLHHRYGFTWPDVLSCDRFPAEDEQVCIGPDSLESISGQSQRLDNIMTTAATQPPTTVKATSTTNEQIKPQQTTSMNNFVPGGGKQLQAACLACSPMESVEEVMQRACSSQIVFRARMTKVSKRFFDGPMSLPVYDVNLARRIRVVAEQPPGYLPGHQQLNLRTILEKGMVRSVSVNASGDCSCALFGDRKGSGMTLIFANSFRGKVRGGQDQTVRFEMTGYIQLGQQMDKSIKRLTQKLKRQPLENICSSGAAARQKPAKTHVMPMTTILPTTTSNFGSSYEEGPRRRQQQQQQQQSSNRNRGGQGRRRLSTSRPENRGHLLAYW